MIAWIKQLKILGLSTIRDTEWAGVFTFTPPLNHPVL